MATTNAAPSEPTPTIEQQLAIEAVYTEAVYDASRRARLQQLGREPVPEPSERAWELYRRTTAAANLPQTGSRLAWEDLEADQT